MLPSEFSNSDAALASSEDDGDYTPSDYSEDDTVDQRESDPLVRPHVRLAPDEKDEPTTYDDTICSNRSSYFRHY